MPDLAILVAVRRGSAVVAGSKPGRCADCGTEIMISPSGQRLIEQENLKPVCPECAVAVVAQSDEATVQPLTPEQLTEIDAYRRRNWNDEGRPNGCRD